MRGSTNGRVMSRKFAMGMLKIGAILVAAISTATAWLKADLPPKGAPSVNMPAPSARYAGG